MNFQSPNPNFQIAALPAERIKRGQATFSALFINSMLCAGSGTVTIPIKK